MKPVDQVFRHDPANGIHGDCQRAVIASLLELPIEDVPHFAKDHYQDPDSYWTALQSFLGCHGYAYVTVKPGEAHFFGDLEGVYHEIAGQSPRDPQVMHAVVGLDGKIVHDPHPDKTGLAGDPNSWQYSFIIKKC